MVGWWVALEGILLVSVLGLMHEEAIIVQGWDKPNLGRSTGVQAGIVAGPCISFVAIKFTRAQT